MHNNSPINDFKNNPSIPQQKLLTSQKGKKWQKANIDGIIHLAGTAAKDGRSSKQNKQENYDIVNSIFNKEDFLSVTNRYNIKQEDNESLPIQMFNIVRSKIERLKGEEMQRLFGFMAVGLDGEVLQIRKDQRKAIIRQHLEQKLQEAIGQPQVDEQGNPIPQAELEEKLRDFDNNWKDIREKWVNDILQYLKRRENLELKFNEGWEHALIAGEECYYAGISNSEPKLRVVYPLSITYPRTPNMSKIQQAEWLVEERWMSRSEILDEYGEDLDNGDLKLIDSDDYNAYLGTFHPSRMVRYPGGPPSVNSTQNIIDQGGYSEKILTENEFHSGNFKVYCVVWKSWKKIGFLTYFDENGEELTVPVDDSFSLEEDQKEAGWKVEWSWIIDVWKGHYIEGLKIYFGMGSIENQVNGELPYIGRIYSATNSESTSLVDLMKPYQHIHSLTWHKVKQEIAKAKGKKMIYDLSRLPKTNGMTMDTFLHYFDNTDIAFIDTSTEGNEGMHPQNQSNFFQQVDLGISSTFNALMATLLKIEEGVDSISGISKQREGDISASETATNAGRAIAQSTYITEPLFYIHNECKREALVHLVKVAQMAYKDGKMVNFLKSDGVQAMLEIDGDVLNDSEYDIFLSGSASDRQILESMKGLLSIGLQSDKLNFSDAISMFKATSIAEAETVLRAGEQDKIERDQAAQESANNVAIQQQELANQGAKEARDWEAVQKQLDRDNKLAVAQISQLGLYDGNSDGVPDIMALEGLKLKDKQHSADIQLEKEKLAQQKAKDERDAKLKEKEIEVKKIAAKKKPAGNKK
jgi:hypothetical protein